MNCTSDHTFTATVDAIRPVRSVRCTLYSVHIIQISRCQRPAVPVRVCGREPLHSSRLEAVQCSRPALRDIGHMPQCVILPTAECWPTGQYSVVTQVNGAGHCKCNAVWLAANYNDKLNGILRLSITLKCNEIFNYRLYSITWQAKPPCDKTIREMQITFVLLPISWKKYTKHINSSPCILFTLHHTKFMIGLQIQHSFQRLTATVCVCPSPLAYDARHKLPQSDRLTSVCVA